MRKLITAVCIITPLLGQVGTSLALPKNEYACKVQTASIHIGVVMVQAHDLASAQSIAATAPATRMDGKVEKAQSVLECIRFPGDRFGDTEFQAFIESMPR